MEIFSESFFRLINLYICIVLKPISFLLKYLFYKNRSFYVISVFFFLFYFSNGYSQSKIINTINYHKKISEFVREVYVADSLNEEYKHGTYKLYYRGKLQVKGNYHGDKKHGYWERFNRKGKLVFKALYVNGKLHGKVFNYYNNGVLSAEMSFVKGKKDGVWKGFNSKGNLLTIQHYSLDSLLILENYYPQGGLSHKEQYMRKGGAIIEIVGNYYDNGLAYEIFTLKNNKLDSIYSSRHYFGAPWEVIKYENGLLRYVYEMNNEDGVAMLKGSIRNGNGTLFLYHKDGTKYADLNYTDGKKSATCKYYLNKALRVDGFYKNNLKMGLWKYYSWSNRKLEREINYFDGVGTFYIKNYGIGGGEKQEGELLDGLKTGLWKTYDYYGEIKQEEEYAFGFNNGIFKKKQGKATKELGGYKYGVKIGKWNKFNNRQKVTYKVVFDNVVTVDSNLIDIFLPQTFNIHRVTKYNYQPYVINFSFVGEGIEESLWLDQIINNAKKTSSKFIRGAIIVQLKVNISGEISKVLLVRGIDGKYNKVVQKGYEQSPYWNPVLVNGIPQETTVNQFVNFGDEQEYKSKRIIRQNIRKQDVYYEANDKLYLFPKYTPR